MQSKFLITSGADFVSLADTHQDYPLDGAVTRSSRILKLPASSQHSVSEGKQSRPRHHPQNLLGARQQMSPGSLRGREGAGEWAGPCSSAELGSRAKAARSRVARRESPRQQQQKSSLQS